MAKQTGPSKAQRKNTDRTSEQSGALEQQLESEPPPISPSPYDTTLRQLQLFDGILETTPDLICTTDPVGQVLYMNQACRAMLGLEKDVGIGDIRIAALYPTWALERLVNQAIPTALSEGLWRGESAVLGPNGEVPVSQVLITHTMPDKSKCVSAVMREISEYKQLEAKLYEIETRYWRIASKAPGMVYHYLYHKHGDGKWLFVSEGCRDLFGIEPADLQANPTLFEALIHPDDVQSYRISINDEADDQELWQWEGRVVLPSGVMKWVQGTSRPETQPNGDTVWDGIFLDITQHKLAEERLLKLQEQIIATQRATLIELSTPLLTISDGVLIMPLIGSVDTRRAQQTMETLLRGITTHQARVVILDITGVPVVDHKVANMFVLIAEAAHLLGAKVVLTGIRPEVAQTLVDLGIDLSRMLTESTLQAGITWALRRR